MSFVTQEIASLTGGVSQAPARLRLDSQLESLVNGWVEATRGLGKRPPSEHVARLDTDNTNLGAAFLHTINRDEDERYRVVIENADLKVYNEGGTEQTVLFPHGKTYLSESSPRSAFRAVTVGDRTFIANNTQVVAKSTSATDQAPRLAHEALLWIREGDFSTNYFCTFGVPIADSREYTTYNATITSGAGTDTTDRTEYDAKFITDKLFARMVGTGEDDAAMHDNGWIVTQYDTVIHVKRSDGGDFKVAAGEGLEGSQDVQMDATRIWDPGWMESYRRRIAQTAGKNIFVAIKDTVQFITDLPPVAPEGFRTQVIGDASTEWDNYWFRYSNGSWQECIAPAEVSALNASTMPHQLLLSTKVYENMAAINGPAPKVIVDTSSGSPQTESAFNDTLNDAGSAVDVDNPLTTEGEPFSTAYAYCYANMEDADGAETEYTFTFTVDCRQLPDDGTAKVKVWLNDGVGSTNWAEAGGAASKYYTKADGLKTDTIVFTATVTTNWDFRVELNTQLDWEVATKYAELVPTSITFMALASNTDKIIDLHEDRIYPKGCIVTATVNGNANPYTVTGDDETADEVATGLELLIEDDTDITSSASGHLITVSHASATPTVVIATTYDPTKTVILNDTYGFSADSLAAQVVENRTDLSTSTITTNGSRSITCASALTGGTDNTFVADDAVRVVVAGAAEFSFGPVNWDKRAVGDERSNPWPSFIGQKITEVFFHSGRLGLTHMESVSMTRAGDITNFFRKTARALLDGDGIDVTYSGRGSALIHSAVETNTEMVFFTELGQLHLKGEPTLTPRTVELLPWTSYENTSLIRPIPYGDRVLFLQADAGATQAFAFRWREEQLPTGDPIGEHVPTYIAGNPLAWAVSSQHKLVAILTDADQSGLYVGRLTENRDDLDASWMRWSFGANDSIIGVDVIDDTLGLVVLRDEGLFLETINISEGFTDDYLMDRRLTQADVSDVLNGSDTDITVPFSMPDGDGDFVVYDTTNAVEYKGASITRPDATTIKVVGADLTAANYYIGWQYTFTAQLSEIFPRHWRTGMPVLGGTLMLGNIMQYYASTIDLTIVVTVNAVDYTYTVSNSSASEGEQRFPVVSEAGAATIVYSNATSRPVWLQGVNWEGTLSARGRKL